MVSVLVPLLVASASASNDVSATDIVTAYQGVEVWLDTRGGYERGEYARVHARANEDGFLLVLHADAAGRVRVLFPIDPYVDDFVRGGETLEILGRGDRDAFLVDQRTGTGVVLAAWSPDPFRFDEFVLGDHWDYRALSPLRSADAEAELLDLAQRMAAGPFDYDAVEYVVGAPAPYRRSPIRIATSWYDPWCVGCTGWGPVSRSGFYLSVGFGSFGTHASIGYGPFYSAVRPIWHRPIWHRPIWYRPAYYVPRHARLHRFHPVWGHHHPGHGRRWGHHHRHRHYWPYYYDRSGIGIHVRYTGLFDWGGAVFAADYYTRSRPGILRYAYDRPFDGSGRRVKVRRAVLRNDDQPRAGERRAVARYGVGRANDATTRTPLRTARVRGGERGADERRAATRRSSRSDTRAARPRLIREDVSSARVREANARQATSRARSETRPRASSRSASVRAARPRSSAERASSPSSSRVQRSARPRQSEARNSASSEARRTAVQRSARPRQSEARAAPSREVRRSSGSEPARARRTTPSQVQRSAPSARSRSSVARPSASSRSRPSARPSASRQSRPSARPSASRQSRPSARPSASRQSRPSVRPSRSASRPEATSRSSRSRPKAAQASRGERSSKARSTRSSGKRGGGKKR